MSLIDELDGTGIVRNYRNYNLTEIIDADKLRGLTTWPATMRLNIVSLHRKRALILSLLDTKPKSFEQCGWTKNERTLILAKSQIRLHEVDPTMRSQTSAFKEKTTRSFFIEVNSEACGAYIITLYGPLITEFYKSTTFFKHNYCLNRHQGNKKAFQFRHEFSFKPFCKIL